MERTGRTERRESIGERFGGVDTPASLAGMFTALGVLAFLSSLLAAGAAGIPFQLNQLDLEGNLAELQLAGYLIALIVVFVSFFVGGWAAGRMALLDGDINGVAMAIWTLLLVVLMGAAGAFLGDQYNAFAQAELPNWIAQMDADDITLGAGLATLLMTVVMFFAGWLGGRVGELGRERTAALTGHTTTAHTTTD